MKKIEDSQILHSEMLNILRYINSLCELNDIKYTLIYGTLIGAYRHNGIIPWDDDIDIAMDRDNYEKFRSIFKDTKDYCFYDDRSCRKWFIPFCGCVRSKRYATYDEKTKSVDCILSLRVDIYPFDYIGNTIEEAKRCFDISHNYTDHMGYMVLNKRYATLRWNKMKCTVWNIVFFIPRYIKHLIKKVFWKKQKKKIASITQPYIKKEPTKFIACLWDLNNKRSVFINFFSNGFVSKEFENEMFPTIKDYDYFLTTCYGDWKTPPSVGERIPYHLGSVVLLDDDEMSRYYGE